MAPPKKPAAEVRSHSILIRLTKGERAQLERAAKKARVSVSEFVRRAALGQGGTHVRAS